MFLSILLLLLILLVLVIFAPVITGAFYWMWRRLHGRPMTFEDACCAIYEMAYPNPKKM